MVYPTSPAWLAGCSSELLYLSWCRWCAQHHLHDWLGVAVNYYIGHDADGVPSITWMVDWVSQWIICHNADGVQSQKREVHSQRLPVMGAGRWRWVAGCCVEQRPLQARLGNSSLLAVFQQRFSAMFSVRIMAIPYKYRVYQAG